MSGGRRVRYRWYTAVLIVTVVYMCARPYLQRAANSSQVSRSSLSLRTLWKHMGEDREEDRE
jgi:hypothetical protein